MKKIIHIKGMHCISCEIVLEKELKSISDVQLIMLNHKNGIMEVEYTTPASFNKIKKAIEKNGFIVEEDGKKTTVSMEKIIQNITLYLGIGVFVYLFSLIDLYKYLPDTSTLSYTGAVLIGIVASVSTCLALTGGIIIGFARYIDHEHGFKGHIKVQGLFQLGRVGGFFLLGGMLGYLGSMFQINFGFTGILTFFIGFLLLYMGLNILGVLPSITKIGIHMPKVFVNKIEHLGEPKYAPIVGALTFFIPCGFTQTLQLVAVSSGSFWTGGLIMMFFALGTLPVLLSVGLGSSYFKDKKFHLLNTIIGIIVLVFGVFTISNSYNLISLSLPEKNIAQEGGVENITSDVEIMHISHNGWSTEPSIVRLKAGGNYKVIVTPSKNGMGCMGTQTIPKLSKQISYVTAGEPIVYEFNNAKKGIYDIVCASMGMEQGKIIIE